MAEEKKVGRQLGPTGETVRRNIRWLRDEKNVSGAELSARLGEIGRPIPPLGIQRIEAGTRRVDVDDLVAFAVALEVSPVTLLSPNAEDQNELVTATGLSDALSAEDFWKWVRAERPLGGPADGVALLDYIKYATPLWRSRQYAEGVLALLEINTLQRDLGAGGEQAAEAQRRLNEINERYRLDGDD